ncbi:diacylglycerol kinase family protein [Roseisolibacter sp. H3M3-2]|uniref:diacylglycerol/lipid kinase family protein n=1 Tax=Roseisolibacter sp. H3M3-2 TaxID=3031323 RepID=UPI0023DC3489|nr:diacylglycerol kinase family protein [Roseisolibacter sp. H3M3-2]MDF1504584.1 diacylglycerol kinase family protein [Roseisolibacter sp. H3M3-2]
MSVERRASSDVATRISSVLLIVNPAARQAAALESEATGAFTRAGVACAVRRTERAGHAAELAAACGEVDAVFTLGGDGTAMEVVGALAHGDVPVGILPGGTGNLVARTLGVPLAVPDAVASLLRGRVARVDLGVVEAEGAGARRFAFAAGVGIDARMIEETPARWKRRLGVLAYALTAARAIVARDRFAVRVVVDGGEEIRRDAAAVMIVNFGAVLGDLFRFGPGIEADDGRLDLCLFSPDTVGDAVRVLWRLSRRDFRDDRCLLYRAGREFRVETAPSRAAQADGELLGRTPLVARVEPLAATLLVPAS